MFRIMRMEWFSKSWHQSEKFTTEHTRWLDNTPYTGFLIYDGSN